MKNILPVPPEDLDPLAAEILGGLRGQSDAKPQKPQKRGFEL